MDGSADGRNGTYDKNGKAETVASISGSGHIILGSTANLTYNGNGTKTFSGSITGSGRSALVKPGCQRTAGFQYVAFGDRTGALSVVIGDRLNEFVVLIQGVLFVFGEEG